MGKVVDLTIRRTMSGSAAASPNRWVYRREELAISYSWLLPAGAGRFRKNGASNPLSIIIRRLEAFSVDQFLRRSS